MAMISPLIDYIPSLDITKEQKRWNRFINRLNDPKPKVNHTPRQVVWKKNKSTLWHYPAVEKKHETPIFIVYSLVNKPYIFDLAPGISAIEQFVNRGYEVYLLDWGVLGYEDKGITLDDYIVDHIQKAVKRALRHSNAEDITIWGACLGGVMASIYAAISEEPIKNLILSTPPIDFRAVTQILPEKLAESILNNEINVDRFVDVNGLIPPRYLHYLCRFISSPIHFSSYATLLNHGYNDKFADKWARMDMWTKDHVPMSGEVLRQIYNDLIIDNKLMKGELIVCGKRVDFKNIQANLLVMTAANDNVVPEEASLPIMDLVSSKDKTYEKFVTGHIGMFLSNKCPDFMDKWLAMRTKQV
ncbi:MAG TPA: alpha/beta fold hydrolase [Ureibacillus sp.]|nr:alpha/beta fold hydrolase [Ureibacillus sp.]